MTVRARSSTAYLLGAGFSKAVHPVMPLMAELGKAVCERLTGDAQLRRYLTSNDLAAIDAGQVPLGDVETWLTSLSTDQPFLSVSENLARRALFFEIAKQIGDHIESCTRQAQVDPVPSWLRRLLTIWHLSASDVLTLNYDSLIESAALNLNLRSERGDRAMVGNMLGAMPPRLPVEGARWGAVEVDTFALRKLHGSTSWFGRPSNSDFYSVVRDDSQVTYWIPDEPTVPESAAVLMGMQRVILPPIADKANLYGNATLSALWQQARLALESTEELIIIGYSVPRTDSSMLALLNECVRPDARIFVVDKYPDPVIDNLKPLAPRAVTACGPPDATTFAEIMRGLEERIRAHIDLEPIRAIHESSHIEAVLPGGVRWPIESHTIEDDLSVSLRTENEAIGTDEFRVLPSVSEVPLPRIVDRVELVRFPDGRTAVPLRYRVTQSTNEHSSVSIDVSEPS